MLVGAPLAHRDLAAMPRPDVAVGEVDARLVARRRRASRKKVARGRDFFSGDPRASQARGRAWETRPSATAGPGRSCGGPAKFPVKSSIAFAKNHNIAIIEFV